MTRSPSKSIDSGEATRHLIDGRNGLGAKSEWCRDLIAARDRRLTHASCHESHDSRPDRRGGPVLASARCPATSCRAFRDVRYAARVRDRRCNVMQKLAKAGRGSELQNFVRPADLVWRRVFRNLGDLARKRRRRQKLLRRHAAIMRAPGRPQAFYDALAGAPGRAGDLERQSPSRRDHLRPGSQVDFQRCRVPPPRTHTATGHP